MTSKYTKLYCLPASAIRKNTKMDGFVFCGKNWDYYFSDKKTGKNVDIFENVEITDCPIWKMVIDWSSETEWLFIVFSEK